VASYFKALAADLDDMRDAFHKLSFELMSCKRPRCRSVRWHPSVTNNEHTLDLVLEAHTDVNQTVFTGKLVWHLLGDSPADNTGT
jgi:hypothetical protein